MTNATFIVHGVFAGDHTGDAVAYTTGPRGWGVIKAEPGGNIGPSGQPVDRANGLGLSFDLEFSDGYLQTEDCPTNVTVAACPSQPIVKLWVWTGHDFVRASSSSGPPATGADLKTFVLAGQPADDSRYRRAPLRPDAKHWGVLPAGRQFTTPSGNIACVISDVLTPGAAHGVINHVVCHVTDHMWGPPAHPPNCGYISAFVDDVSVIRDYGIGKPHTFTADQGCLPGPIANVGRVLPYGDSIQQGEIACRSDVRYLACVDLVHKDGFLVSRDMLRLY